MIIVRFAILLLIVFLLNISCAEKPDIGYVDSLINIGRYDKAMDILKSGRYSAALMPVDKKRIQTRIFRLERIIFFRILDEKIINKNWPLASSCADSLKIIIDQMDKKQSGPYRFDFFYKKSIIDSILLGIEAWKTSLTTALDYYTPDYEKEQFIYEQLAFYYAEKGEFIIAREQMDKSIRKLSGRKTSPQLNEILKLYMEGQFAKTYKNLVIYDENLKNEHWKALQRFLEKYGALLTMEDRFKLW